MSFPSTVLACIESGAQRFTDADLFYGHGTDNAHDEAFWLVFFALSLPFDSDDSVFEQAVTETEWQTITLLFDRRVNERVPVAYLTGEGWFCGYPFTVNAHVLVPRSPIAELIQQSFQPWLSETPTTPLRILDMCTGCGCIGIATALQFSEARVDLTDISTQAIQVAQDNVQRYDLASRVSVITSDVFAGLQGKQYDLIVTNPPYVDARDLASMPAEYHTEPAIALGSGDDGLDITRRLLREAADYLTPDGMMIVEVGNSWENLEAAFPSVPFLWIDFTKGGNGVFLIRRGELLQYHNEFMA